MKNHNKLIAFSFQLSAFAFLVYCPVVSAAPAELILRYQHHLFILRPAEQRSWMAVREEWRYLGRPFRAPQELRIDRDDLTELPSGITRTRLQGWDTDAIAATLQSNIASEIDREPGAVTIHRAGDGTIAFKGLGLPGRSVDVPAAATLIVSALKFGVADVVLPVHEIPATVQVLDDPLRDEGIAEVVAVGESAFAGSPKPRRHNIAVGLQRFNGHRIPRGTVFSFNEVLGPVNAATGYQKELVILGERTLPDYGGGLCQVSTTAYRGAWEYGLPIDERKNHSFAVRYYGPQGTDATVYPPNVDLTFTNDTPGALLIQTHVDGDRAYFIYYGTRDDRIADVFGPFTWGATPPPADRVEYTAEIPAGTMRKVGDAVPGMRAAWFRVLQARPEGNKSTEGTYSIYEARPLFTQIGVAAGSPLLSGSISSMSAFSSTSSTRSRIASSAITRPSRRRE